MERDELIGKLSHLLAGLQVPLSIDGDVMLGAGAQPLREILGDMPGFGWRQAHDFHAWLTDVLTPPEQKRQPHWTDDVVALTFDGELISDHGMPAPRPPKNPGGMICTYPVHTVADAVRIHTAWLAWTDARSRLTARSSDADRRRVVDLEQRFRNLRSELEVTDGG